MKHFTLSLMAFVFAWGTGNTQTLFWSDDFEDTGSPSSGVRIPETDAGSGDIYFKRTNGSDITTVNLFSNINGTKFWAGEDHGDVVPPGEFELQIEFNNISITGLTNLQFSGTFAANDFPVWESLAFASHDDYIIVEYSIDNSPTFQPLVRFYANDGTAKELAEETSGDNIGEGTVLTHALTEFTKNIPSTGNEIDLRIRVYTNGTNEEWAIDNFRLFHTSCIAPIIGTQAANSSNCISDNTSFAIDNVTNATAYQWQVDMGGGFTNLSNDATYSGVTTQTLNITNVQPSMNNYVYRCVVINDEPACFTNSDAATLTVTTLDLSTSVDAGTITSEQDGASYQWIDCSDDEPINGATSQTFTPEETGSYAVIVTLNSCSDTSDCVNITTSGIDELTYLHATLYPNPSKGNVTIDWGTELSSVQIEVTDITGKTVYAKENLFGSSCKLELQQLSGIYYVRISNGEEQAVLKLILD